MPLHRLQLHRRLAEQRLLALHHADHLHGLFLHIYPHRIKIGRVFRGKHHTADSRRGINATEPDGQIGILIIEALCQQHLITAGRTARAGRDYMGPRRRGLVLAHRPRRVASFACGASSETGRLLIKLILIERPLVKKSAFRLLV
jgi:hypothetical protein